MIYSKFSVLVLAMLLGASACSTDADDWQSSLVEISGKYDEVDDSLSAATPEEAERVVGDFCEEMAVEDFSELGDPEILKPILVGSISDLGLDSEELNLFFESMSDGMKEICPTELADLEGFLGEPFADLAAQ